MNTLKNDKLITIETKTFIDKIHGYAIPQPPQKTVHTASSPVKHSSIPHLLNNP